jgi:hypothetical protein
MRYEGIVVTEYGLQFATASSLHAATKQSLALRHARAMAACYGALKTWAREQSRVPRNWTALEKADARLQAATARLVAVEGEVERG